MDRELLLKEYDAQVTLAMDPAVGVQDQKLELSGRLRRLNCLFRCTVHSVDKVATPGADLGKVMRNKVTEQVKAIIRENRTLPYQTAYNLAGLGYPEGDPHKAFAAGSSSELAPSSASWTELTNVEYQNVWYSDDLRYTKSADVNGQFAMALFRFKIGPREQCVKSLVLSFEGFGIAPGGDGVTVKVWNHTASAWQNPQTGTAPEDQTLSITISSNWTDYVDSNGYVWLLARTTYASDGVTPAALYCDFVQLVVQVRGITYCDVASYRPDVDTSVKPFLYRTEFVLKGWVFESLAW